jgi:hypothetical protein
VACKLVAARRFAAAVALAVGIPSFLLSGVLTAQAKEQVEEQAHEQTQKSNSRAREPVTAQTAVTSSDQDASNVATSSKQLEVSAQLTEAERKLHFDAVDCSQGAHMCRIRLSVTNDSDIPITVDATKAELRKDHSILASAKVSEQMVSKKGKASLSSFLTAAVSVGTVQTMQEIKEQKGDVLKRYEGDEQKRGIEEAMFGKTLLSPGTSNSGYIYFSKSSIDKNTYLRCPVETFYAPKSANSADVQIKQQMALTSEEGK